MLKFGPTFIWTAVNLLVLYIVLKKKLFKRVTQFMENRAKSIKDAIDNAEKNKSEASELKAKYEQKLISAKNEADKIINDARGRANREYDSMIASAKRDAENILAEAREEIEREKVQMMKEVRNQVASLALVAASKLMETDMNNERNRVLVDKFIDEAGAA